MDVGVHCAVCGQLDFLPFTCPHCGAELCLEHRNHGCRQEAEPEPLPVHKNSKKKPSEPSSQPKSQNRVVGTTPSQSRGQTLGGKANPALEKLRGLVSGKGRSFRGSWKPDPLAGLKKEAQGDSKIPESARVYVYVERPSKSYKNTLTGKMETRPSKTMPLFFDKSLKMGQVADRAASKLQTVSHGFEELDSSISMDSIEQGTKLVLKS